MDNIHLTTERIIIRPLELSDLNDFLVYRSNPEVTKYQGFDVMNVDQAAAFIQQNRIKKFGEAGEWVQYGIEKRNTEDLIGDCAIKLDQFDTRIAEIGITISHLEQKKGYAKEALLGILSFLFNTQKIHRVVEIVDTENAASIQLLKSMGFKLEGHFVENIFFKGKWGSEFQYALLKSEWEEMNKGENAFRHSKE